MARVAFLQSLRWPLLGVMHLSALARRGGHETAAFIVRTPRDLRRVWAWSPDLIAMTAQSSEGGWVEEVCRALSGRRGRPFCVLGGLLPTFEPEVIALDGLDAVCRGEGEAAFPELLDALVRGAPPAGIGGLWVKDSAGRVTERPVRPPYQDLDGLPFPHREIYRPYPAIFNGPLWRVWPVRGCIYSCSYCFHHAFRELVGAEGYQRLRSPDNVIEELRHLRDHHGISAIWLGGDTFPVDTAWSYEVIERHGREVGVPFVLSARIERVNERVARALADTGCCLGVGFGVESGDEGLRSRLLRRDVTDKQIIRGSDILKAHGVPTSTTFMMGLPG